MGRVKSQKLKTRLSSALKRNRNVPVFVVAKTARRVRQNPFKRNWRASKLKLSTPHAKKQLKD